MRRTLNILGVAAVFLAAGFLCFPSAAFAEDVWCCSVGDRSYYLDSDTINAESLPKEMTYRAIVKTVLDGDGSLEKSTVYGFESQNDFMVAAMYDKSTEQWRYSDYKNEKPLLQAIWEAMKPYMKERKIPYSDSWEWK